MSYKSVYTLKKNLTNRVAAQVQALTIPAAIKPGLTEREAELNSSEDEAL